MKRSVQLLTALLAAAATSLHAAGTIANLSTYGLVGASAGSLVASIVVEGTAPKNVLVRGVGPGLAAFGVYRPAADVLVEVYDSGGNVVASNRGYLNAYDSAALTEISARVGAFPLTNPGDSALTTTLLPGTYWVEVEPFAEDSADGSALLEVYDTDSPEVRSQIDRLHARGQIGTVTGALTAGFVIGGDAAKTILIRGMGPDLTPPDTAHDAANIASVDLRIYDSKGTLVFFDRGESEDVNEHQITLSPGAYTVQVTLSLPAIASGEAIVEIFDADPIPSEPLVPTGEF